MYTKSALCEGARVLLSAMKYLEKTYGPGTDADVDMRPWVSGDHPLSMAHWILAQKRFKAVSMRRSFSDDPEAQARKKRGLTRVKTLARGIP